MFIVQSDCSSMKTDILAENISYRTAFQSLFAREKGNMNKFVLMYARYSLLTAVLALPACSFILLVI